MSSIADRLSSMGAAGRLLVPWSKSELSARAVPHLPLAACVLLTLLPLLPCFLPAPLDKGTRLCVRRCMACRVFSPGLSPAALFSEGLAAWSPVHGFAVNNFLLAVCGPLLIFPAFSHKQGGATDPNTLSTS